MNKFSCNCVGQVQSHTGFRKQNRSSYINKPTTPTITISSTRNNQIVLKMSAISHWLVNPPFWDQDCLKLLPKNTLHTTTSVTIGEIIEKSDSFPIKFPIDTIRMKTLLSSVPNETLERNVQSAYPVIHESVFHLCAKFLLHKVQFGTDIEKELYKQMNVIEFIERLLTKRAVMFITKSDQYILMDGTNQVDCWETIGTNMEMEPLILKNYLSYDEIKISAFLSVSSYSYFINNGSRYNDGVPSTSRENLADEAIIIGLIGTRLERRETMEFQEVVITKNQNTVINGYGDCSSPNIHNLFAEFYGEKAFLYENVRYGPMENVKRFTELSNGNIFDNCIYAKRLSISFDTLLIEANHRAKEKGTSAYIHVVGIGLGVWRLSIHQEDIFVDTFGKRLSVLGSNINHVSDVHFAYFPRTLTCFGRKDGDILHIPDHPTSGVKIHISEREPNTKLSQAGKLLVVTYAWDGNSLPGNEFWKGFLGNSGDSAAAASSQIAELHNPHINQTVCANNLKIATYNGLVTVQKYIDNVHKT